MIGRRKERVRNDEIKMTNVKEVTYFIFLLCLFNVIPMDFRIVTYLLWYLQFRLGYKSELGQQQQSRDNDDTKVGTFI